MYRSIIHTVSVTIQPTHNGPRMEVMLAKEFVMPISVPQKFGERSIWFVRNPVYIPEPRATVTISKNIISLTSLDVITPSINNDNAPPHKAINKEKKKDK